MHVCMYMYPVIRPKCRDRSRLSRTSSPEATQMCVCVCARARVYTHTHINAYIYSVTN